MSVNTISRLENVYRLLNKCLTLQEMLICNYLVCMCCIHRSPDGSSVLCNSGDNCLRVFDLTSSLELTHPLLPTLVRTEFLLLYFLTVNEFFTFLLIIKWRHNLFFASLNRSCVNCTVEKCLSL